MTPPLHYGYGDYGLNDAAAAITHFIRNHNCFIFNDLQLKIHRIPKPLVFLTVIFLSVLIFRFWYIKSSFLSFNQISISRNLLYSIPHFCFTIIHVCSTVSHFLCTFILPYFRSVILEPLTRGSMSIRGCLCMKKQMPMSLVSSNPLNFSGITALNSILEFWVNCGDNELDV